MKTLGLTLARSIFNYPVYAVALFTFLVPIPVYHCAKQSALACYNFPCADMKLDLFVVAFPYMNLAKYISDNGRFLVFMTFLFNFTANFQEYTNRQREAFDRKHKTD